MARILIDGRVLSHPPITGVGRYVSEISRRLASAGAPHYFELAQPPTQSRIVHHLWEHLYLPIRCAAGRFSILFCPANIAPLVKPPGVKVVLTIHGIAFRFSPESYDKSFRRYYSFLVPWSLRIADAILTVSTTEKNSILTAYPWISSEKIHVIASGVDHAVFNDQGKPQARDILQRRYGITSNFVLGVGSSKPVKNLARLIEAYQAVRDRIGAQLVLVGEMPMTVPSNVPGVIALGHIDADLPHFYKAAKMLVFPSLYEGFGFPPLEAMACSCPVIVSTAGALPEVCGDAAHYVAAEDVGAITAAMVQIAEDAELQNTLVDRGCRRAKNFTWEKTAAETVKIFESLCA